MNAVVVGGAAVGCVGVIALLVAAASEPAAKPSTGVNVANLKRRQLSRREFVETYLLHARAVAETYTGLPPELVLAQAALESGWGRAAAGNNFFGVKAGSSWQGDKALLWTTEYHKHKDVRYPVVRSVELQEEGPHKGLYKYVVKDWFRAYPTAREGFADHALVLMRVWPQAFAHADPIAFARIISGKDGGPKYATAANYYEALSSVIRDIQSEMRAIEAEAEQSAASV